MEKRTIVTRLLVSCLAAFTFLTAPVACGDDEATDRQKQEQQQDDEQQDGTDHAAVEVHQICAAAGESSSDTVTSLNCFGPQDPSARVSESGEKRWEPGALRIVAE